MRTTSIKGFTLIEMLVYVSVLGLIMLLAVTTALSMARSYEELKVARSIEQGALTSMERMVRDIRAAEEATASGSTLTLTTTDLNDDPMTVIFYVQDGILKVIENGSYAGPLTASSTSVTSLSFDTLSTTTSKAVRIQMTMEASRGEISKTQSFYSTAVLRGYYR